MTPVHNRIMAHPTANSKTTPPAVWRRYATESAHQTVIHWQKNEFDIAELNNVYTTFVTDAAGSSRAWGELTSIGKLGREVHQFQEHLFQATHAT